MVTLYQFYIGTRKNTSIINTPFLSLVVFSAERGDFLGKHLNLPFGLETTYPERGVFRQGFIKVTVM
jgi:hypothetical protein